jgi:hypothetical protein
MSISETGQRSEAPKIISTTAPVTTDNRDAKPGTFRREAAPVALPVLLAAAALRDGDDGVVSPSVFDALPRTELSISHNWRMFFTSEGRFKSAESNTSVWFVLSKLGGKKRRIETMKKERDREDSVYQKNAATHQSAHCGKVDSKVSVQAHLITSMNAPGLKMTFSKWDSGGASHGNFRVGTV